MQRYFITASGTEVGKTLVTTSLCWQLRQRGKKVTALKPVITGFKNGDEQSDTALILRSCGLHPSEAVINTISPWRFEPALAPHMAVKKITDAPQLDEVVRFCKSHETLESNVVLAEGFGGTMAPLNYKHTMLDIMDGLCWPAIIVGGSYLGAISHTLTAYESLRNRGIPVAALVISESASSTVGLKETVKTVERFIDKDTPVAKIPRLEEEVAKWKQAPLINWVLSDE